jgi:hypothetical protein
MAVNNPVLYGNRTFTQIRADLISLIRQYYPEVLSDFTDSSVGAMMIDLNAGVANNLSVNTDRAFQETQLEYAQQRASILNIAKNLGFNIPNLRPSVTVIDFTVTIPVKGNTPDSSYYPILAAGAQVVGGGKIFETQSIIDWNSPVSNLGDSNRKIIANQDSNGITQSYSVTKREIVVNGSTNIYKRPISFAEVTPFLEITLPDANVIEVQDVILLEGLNYSTNPSPADFANAPLKYYEVDYLAQQQIFLENNSTSLAWDSLTGTTATSSEGIQAGRWFEITKKFLKEYDNNGYCVLTFGGGNPDQDAFKNGFIKEGVTNQQFLLNYLANTSLGETLKRDHTLFVKYRVGGGSSSNLGSNVLTSLGTYQMLVQGALANINNVVKRSLTVTNPIPAIGGNDGLSIEQIRHLIKYNFSSQGRDVTLTDYLVQVYKMPGKFGSPFRANTFKLNNKVIISILGIDAGKLSNTSTSLLKENIAEYLLGYRMINDYVEIKDGAIYNLAFDIDLYVENGTDSQIASNVITLVRDYFNINNFQMNEDVFLGDLQREILLANGVINIIDIKVYNRVGGQYSMNVIPQEFTDTSTGQIKIINNTIYSTQDSMFEIKYPEKDITVYLRKKADLTN